MSFEQFLPPEGVKIVLVLFLSFLVGLEREEHKEEGDYAFGGVRTFPLIGLIGYAAALLSGTEVLPVAIGFAVIAAFMLTSYRHKIAQAADAGVTSEVSGLTVYLIGALTHYDHYWVATTIAVISLLLLELKAGLENLAKKTEPGEILTFAKFLLLTAVILPVLPNESLGPFQLNPFKTWLVVVAVSSVSYGSYVVQRATKGQGGILAAALLGGAYSSTVTTVVLAKRAREENRPHLFAGGILVASGVMYVRLVILLAMFNRTLAGLLAPSFAVLSATALLIGLALMRWPDGNTGRVERRFVPKNPLELGAAALFALVFLVMLIATKLAVSYVGRAGVYALAALMGVADVDPFIMGMTQAAGASTGYGVAATAILITVASNNAVKGLYAWFFADARTGREALIGLVALSLAGFVPLAFLVDAW